MEKLFYTTIAAIAIIGAVYFLFVAPCWLFTYTNVPGRCVSYFAH